MSRRSRGSRHLVHRFRAEVELVERRTLLSVTASAFSENVLDSMPSTIDLGPYVADSDPSAVLTFELVSTTTSDGGAVSVNAATGLVNYTPAVDSPPTDTFQYSASDSDGDSSSTVTVTLNLSSIAANPVIVSEVQGQSTIALSIVNLPGAVQDSATKPAYTFSNVLVANGAGGTVSLNDANFGAFTYTPPSSTFTGNVIISYVVGDGTGTESSTVQIDIGPIAADPVVWGTLSSSNATIPSTDVPSLVDRIHDVGTHPSYTFSNSMIPAGEGTITNLNPATGAFTYAAPDSTFSGVVPMQYSVSDGTNSTSGSVTIVVAPLVTQPVTVTELDHQSSVSLEILNLTGAVQDSSSNPAYTFSDLRVVDGGGAVASGAFTDTTTGAFTYNLPGSATAHPVHVGYTVSDGTNMANGIVTLQLVGIEAATANFAVLQNTESSLPALIGRIDDVKSTPTFTFSSPSVPAGDGTVVFTDAAKGVLSYSPPSAMFTGTFPVQYTVSDGTNTTTGVLNLSVAALVTSPLLIPAALQTGPTDVPSLVASGHVQDVASDSTYSFSNLMIGPGDGTVKLTNAASGAFTYTPPSGSFFGVVQVTYAVTDGTLHSASGSVIINVEETIRPGNDGPLAAVAGQALVIPAAVLLGNDAASPNGLKPSIGAVGEAANGKVVLNADGSVTFTPTTVGPASFEYEDTDADRDASLAAKVTLNVKIEPTIFWSDPGEIVQGTPLSGTQLDAYASVAGSFTYTPQAGTILAVGNGQTLSVNFTPYDTTYFTAASATVTINVGPAPPPGLSVVTHPLSGRHRRKVGGVIAQLHTTLSKLNATYYTALVNWGDGVVARGKLVKSGKHAFKVNATHVYGAAGKYRATVTISDRLGHSVTEPFVVLEH